MIFKMVNRDDPLFEFYLGIFYMVIINEVFASLGPFAYCIIFPLLIIKYFVQLVMYIIFWGFFAPIIIIYFFIDTLMTLIVEYSHEYVSIVLFIAAIYSIYIILSL